MKKGISATIITAALTAAMSMSALAAGWQGNAESGWWYGTNDDNSQWYANGWQWIDGNGDGIAECYYFDQNGYLLTNTVTPDGYQVNPDGAWVIGGSVQVQNVQAQENMNEENGTVTDFPKLEGLYLDTNWNYYYFVHTTDDGTLQLYLRNDDGSEGSFYFEMAYIGDGKWSNGDGSIFNTNAWITDGENFHISMGGYMQRVMVKQ